MSYGCEDEFDWDVALYPFLNGVERRRKLRRDTCVDVIGDISPYLAHDVWLQELRM